jgi:hypothetical protein
MKRKYLGGCHCGRIRFEALADLEGERKGICNCSSCTMKGFIHHHIDKRDFNLTSGFDDLKLYKFGTLSAEHYFCKYCGVESFYRSRSDPNQWDINVRCLTDAATGERVDIYALRYELGDGAHWDESQAKRHERAARAKDHPEEKHEPALWRLLAPEGAVDPAIDVAAEFRKTWDDGRTATPASKGKRRGGRGQRPA